MSEENEEKRGRGQPRAFETEEDFLYKFKEYIEYCKENKRFPNVAGFCSYVFITRETYYKQKEYYSDTYNIVEAILEDEVLQHNTYMAQLYLKNKCGYKDKVETEQSGSIKLTYEESLKKVEGNEY